MSAPDEPVSVVEDLDPEPAQPAGRFQLRELVLGLMLLICVLAFAGWQWWSQAARESSYNGAVEALAGNDLDQARALFAGASGYRDADSRAQDLEQKIALRDSLYIAATDQISVDNWPFALPILRRIRAIQPGFRDIAELERAAVGHLALKSLGGSVALREPPGGPSGLYYRRGSQWVYLPGSDADSRILGSGAPGILVYDVPGNGTGAGARRTVVADSTREPARTDTLPFDPAVYQDFRWNDRGVWAFRHGRYSTPGSPPIVNAMHGIEAEYLAYDSGSTSVVSFDNAGGANGEVLVDVDGTSDRYLTASWTGAQQWSSGILSDTVISLSLGTAGGGSRVIYSTHGVGIDSARLSRDGRYALVTTFRPTSGIGSIYDIFLLDLQNGREPRLIDGVRAIPYSSGGMPAQWIASTFIESGAYEGKVLTTVFNYDRTHLRLYDPDMPDEPLLDVEVPTSSGLVWSVSRSDDRGLVVSGALASYPPRDASTDSQAVPVVQISAGGQYTQTALLIGRYGYPYSVDLAADRLAIVSAQTEEDKYVWTVYAVSAASMGQPLTRAPVIYTQYVPGAIGISGPAPVVIQDGLLTYLQNTALRVRTYDGAVDVPLEEGIRAVYPRLLLNDLYPALR